MTGDDSLADRPFSWTRRQDGTVIISYHAAPVVALRGQRAERFSARMERLDAGAGQQLMARATGNFKRGNERGERGDRKPR